MRNVSDKKLYRKLKHTSYVQQLFQESRAVYKIVWKNVVDPDTAQITIWRMRIACWIKKATKTHSEYVILIAFPLQQSLYECPSVLRYRYSTLCLVIPV